jgi:hypothetical protein
LLATLTLLARPLPVSGKGLFVFLNLYRLLVEVFLLPDIAWETVRSFQYLKNRRKGDQDEKS